MLPCPMLIYLLGSAPAPRHMAPPFKSTWSSSQLPSALERCFQGKGTCSAASVRFFRHGFHGIFLFSVGLDDGFSGQASGHHHSTSGPAIIFRVLEGLHPRSRSSWGWYLCLFRPPNFSRRWRTLAHVRCDGARYAWSLRGPSWPGVAVLQLSPTYGFEGGA